MKRTDKKEHSTDLTKHHSTVETILPKPKPLLTGVAGCGGSSGAVGVETDAAVLCCERGCCWGWSAEAAAGSEACACGGSCVGGVVGDCLGGGCSAWVCGPGGTAGGVGTGAGIAVAGGC